MKSVKLPDSQETIIAMEPLRYKIDDKEVAVPVGAYGHMLSATYNFILCDKAMSDRLRHCLQRNDITVRGEIIPNAMILHNTVATTDDMQDGTVIVDFGGGVTDVSVLYGGKVRYVASIPIGAKSINSDIQTLAIPTSYIEDLKIQYGSALSSLATDDIIVFQAPKRTQTKNILRKNLAIVIEARLKEIAEWIRREIKEAGCGSKFMPTLLLTGGGSQMRDIEKLFAQELEIMEARTVHPEYGFTEESMLEHITSPADATVASLLVYGAKRGSCTIGIRPEPQPAPRPTVRPTGLSSYNSPAPAATEEKPTTPQPQTPATHEPENPVKPKPVLDIDDDDPLKPEKPSFGGRIRKWFTDAGNTFIGDKEEGEF
jgi:cell division protein FtsA